MPTSNMIVKCKVCKTEVPWSELRAHKIAAHPELQPYKHKAKAASDSPLANIHNLEQQIQQQIRLLDTERDQLHARIIEIDNTVAKYRKQ